MWEVLVAAFSTSYSGGFDDSGYVRDGAMLLLVSLLLIVTSLSAGGPRTHRDLPGGARWGSVADECALDGAAWSDFQPGRSPSDGLVLQSLEAAAAAVNSGFRIYAGLVCAFSGYK